jgi:hypothetical protein
MKQKRRPEKFALRVVKGGFQPADRTTESRLRDKGYRVNDIVFVQLTKPRNPKFHRLAHQFAMMLADNIEDFTGLDPHSILKRIQYEANIGCEEMGAKVPGVGFVMIRIPKSLSFESMDEGEFSEVYRNMCRYIAETYWHGMTEEQIAEMAEVMA